MPIPDRLIRRRGHGGGPVFGGEGAGAETRRRRSRDAWKRKISLLSVHKGCELDMLVAEHSGHENT
jgi:hypothetical protein